MTISTFTLPETRFLSNFYPYKNKNGDKYPHDVAVEYDGMTFDCVENAYQAAKAKYKKDRIQFMTMTPFQAKKFADEGNLKVRKNWDSMKLRIMRNLVWQKFSKTPALAKMLLDTGDQELVEGNDWGDRYWGVCDGKGENKLGQILMQVRKDLRQQH